MFLRKGHGRRLLLSFREAIRFLARWELLTIAGGQIAAALVASGAFAFVSQGQAMEMEKLPFGLAFPLLLAAASLGGALVFTAGTVLVIPLAEGRSGLAFRFLADHWGDAALAACVLFAFEVPMLLLFGSMFSPSPPSVPQGLETVLRLMEYGWVLRYTLLLWATAFLLRQVQSRRGEAPSPYFEALWPGCLILLLGTVVPVWLLAEFPLPVAVVLQSLLVRVLLLFGQCWYLRFALSAPGVDTSGASPL